MTDLNALADRVERLQGPDRMADAAIHVALHREDFDNPVPAYTASLDAAMKLVPEGWFTGDFHQGPSGVNWWQLSMIRDGDTYYTSVAGIGKLPAITLTAAALCARALSIKDQSNG